MATCTGDHYVEWIAKYLAECAYSIQQELSVYIGLSSIGCWLFAQIPQIIVNFRLKTAESLSVFFLLQWFLGDSLNLLGCYLSNQNMTQTITAIYFVTMDIVLFSQFMLYQHIYPKCRPKPEELEDEEEATNGQSDNGDSEQPQSTHSMKVYCVLMMLGITLATRLQYSHSHSYNTNTGRMLLSSGTTEDIKYWIGTAVGWGSAAFYLGSRVPQIWKNFKRKSTEGLSPVMFTMAVMGNVTYATSIFLYSTEYNYLWERFPWLLGSLGTLTFDFTTLMQFVWYRKNTKRDEERRKLDSRPLLNKPYRKDVRRAYYARIGIGWHN